MDNRYLIKTTEQWRVDNESSAKRLIEEAKKEFSSSLVKYSSEYKTQKAKGEIVQDWYRVTLVKAFQDEKEPISNIEITYNDMSYPNNTEKTESFLIKENENEN